MVGIASAAIYSVLDQIKDATGLTLGDLNAGTGYMSVRFRMSECSLMLTKIQGSSSLGGDA